MNITWLRLKPLLKELRGIHLELRRANDIKELELAYKDNIHIKAPIADTSGPEPETLYTDEEADAIREAAMLLGKIGKPNE